MKVIHYRIAGVVAILLAVALGVVAYTNGDAKGATPQTAPCAAVTQFNQLQLGMTKHAVQKVLHGRGNPSGVKHNARFYQRNYPICGHPYNKARIAVLYRHGSGKLYQALWLQVSHGTLIRAALR